MPAQTTYRFEHYHENKDRYVPTWAKKAASDLFTLLDGHILVAPYDFTEIKLWKKNTRFIIAKFSKIDCLSDNLMEELNEIGWKFYWFQDFGDHYSFSLKFVSRGSDEV